MASKLSLLKRPINQEIEDKKARISLLESDKRAYSESVNDAVRDCKKRVHQLRKENNKLRKKLYEKLRSDEHVINQAFQKNPMDKSMLIRKTSNVALEIMDGKVCERAKHLNLLRHLTQNKKDSLENLLEKYHDLDIEATYSKETEAGVNKDGQEMRNLENRLDKAGLKCCEAEEIRKVYIHIKDKLQEEYLHYGKDLDALESEIEFCKKDLCHVRVLQDDAMTARDLAGRELKNKEDEVFVDRKRRDKELSYMRKAAETKNVQTDKIDKRTDNRSSTGIMKLEEESQSLLTFNDAYQQKMQKFEDCYKRLQDVSGVMNINEAVQRHENQNNTEMHLKNMINEIEGQCFKQQKEYKKLVDSFSASKYEAETNNFCNNTTRQETDDYIQMKEDYHMTLKKNLNKARSILALCKLSLEHLDDILPAESIHTTEIDKIKSNSDIILNNFERCQAKIDTLLQQISESSPLENKVTMPPILETCAEFQTNVLKNVPHNNTRITIKKSFKDFHIDEDNQESGDDDNVIPTRSMLKKQAHAFVESKLKKKNSKKKKKTKDK